MSKEQWITVRVYGLLVIDGRVLVSDEVIKGKRITKFPGGGLEYGEGPKDCLIREVREEMGVQATDLEHYYTTDHFQQSHFHAQRMQVLSIYYRFQVEDIGRIATVDVPFQGPIGTDGAEQFRWLDLARSTHDDLSLPIDRIVWRMLCGRPNTP